MAQVSNLWRVVQEWLDSVPFPPSQAKLGKAVGVERSAVTDWKSGKSRPKPEHLIALARVMEPAMGPGIHGRLLGAMLEDMGYKPSETKDAVEGRSILVGNFGNTEGEQYAYYTDPRRSAHQMEYEPLPGLTPEQQADAEASDPTDTSDLAIAAHDEEGPIAGEQGADEHP